jgi:putative flippase GtrA
MLNPDMRPFGGTGSLDRFIRYCVVGSVNTAIDVLIFLLLTTDVKMAAVPANIVSPQSCPICFVRTKQNFTFALRGILSNTSDTILSVPLWQSI